MTKKFAMPVLALALAASGSLCIKAQQYGPPQAYHQDNRGQWDAPPSEFNDLNRRAFHDGMDAARSDFRAHRQMNFQRNPMFRRPPAPRQLRDEYRNAFSRGYQTAVDHRDRWQNDNGWRPR